MTTITSQTLTDTTETEMLQCLVSQEQRDFSKLYDRYSSSLYGLIISWIRDTEIAENLLQDVFLKAWRSRQLYDPARGRLFTWLYNIARHICIDHLRSKAHKKSKTSLLSGDMPSLVPEGLIAGGSDPDTIGLRKLVNALSQEEKEVIELMYFKGYTQREIAEIMGTPLGTVKTRMSRAIRNLRYYFKKDWKNAMTNISLN